ncbi:glycosyltransferase family 2 protein [Fortiea sp. LEGE XX443]|uniref:glycosyltransferase family A protein n=1 Tax=Fortiea sp. LEGE XX443 TaxID=1828611 RepID=UPI00187E1F0A|nr:glycosyltransferase family A protein [Fortiea sp. LEGE XX443]MBE9005330.1 glycosyltransferase family 2 protein [Fortiea sp. LEGE XX443]
MKPLVSILIPCYNAEPWLAETLESALQQTWKNIEIIVVDDGSIDSSLQVARKFESPNVKVISQTNRGASAARNKALQEAQGDFIQYLDADDLLASDKIELQMQLLETETSSTIISGKWSRFWQSPTEAQFIPEPVWSDMSAIDWLICSWEGGGMMHPAAWLVPRVIAEAAGYWDETLSLNDDGEYFCRVLLASKGVKFCSRARSYYRSGISSSLSFQKSRMALESAFQSIKLCSSYLLAVEDNPRTRHACATAFQRFIYSAYPNVPDLVKKAEAKVQSFGGSDIKPDGSPLFKFMKSFIGWKLAKEIQIIKKTVLEAK